MHVLAHYINGLISMANDFVKKKGEYLFYSKSPELFGTDFIDIGISDRKINTAKRAKLPIRIITRKYGDFYINPLTQAPNRIRSLDRGYKMEIWWYRFNLNREQNMFDIL